MSVAIKIFSCGILILLFLSCDKRSDEEILESMLHENSPLKGNCMSLKREGRFFVFEVSPNILYSLGLSTMDEDSSKEWTLSYLNSSHLSSNLSKGEIYDYYHGTHENGLWIWALLDQEKAFCIVSGY